MEENQPTIEFDDSRASLVKFDMPISKLKFFVNSIIIFAFHLIAIALYYLFYILMNNPNGFIVLLTIFAIVFGFPILYLNFVNYTKRLWDIVGDLHKGFWINVGIFAISFICLFLFPIAILVFYLVLIFAKGKISGK